ncbi:MAG: hypothetical protein KKI09_14485 [Spirochaetes bacterium]|nr:hypothetical protein [Spirochaetota bacterium]
MKKLLLVLLIVCTASGLVFAGLQDDLKQVDDMHEVGQYDQCLSRLQSVLGQATSNRDKAEVYWRMSRAALNQGNKLKDSNAPQPQTLAKYEEGEGYADQAISADPANYQGYFWKSSNIGMWGQTKGVLNALAKASPMKSLLEQAVGANNTHADSYYVLGQLYRELPGWPVSFGNAATAVSYGRLSVQLNTDDVQAGRAKNISYGFHVELAKSLWNRNWNAGKRSSEQRKIKADFDKARNPIDRGAAYEGSISIPGKSDREEALDLVRNAISSLQRISSRNAGQEDDLKKAQEVLAGWQ